MSRLHSREPKQTVRARETGRFARGSSTPAILGGTPAFAEPQLITRPMLPDRAELDALLTRVFESRWLTNNGDVLRELESRLCRHLPVEWCAAVCNGTVALQIALRSIAERGEVITTPFTFPATVHAIEWNGSTPVFCDIDPDTYNLDVERARERVTERTCALLPVHVFGNPCDLEGFAQLASRNGLALIYDAAHAFGVSVGDRSIGSYGDLSVFSFHATKLFHCGEGGAIVGVDPERFRRVALLRNFGIMNENTVQGPGTNGKMSELHASLALLLLDRVDGEILARRRLLDRYREQLVELGGLKLQKSAPGTVSNGAYCTIEVDSQQFGLSRDLLFAALRAENVVARRYFWPLCSDNALYRDLPSARPELLPNARRVAGRILCLPLHGGMSEDQVDLIVDCIRAIRSAAPAVARATAE